MEKFKYDNHISMIKVKMEFEITRLGERGQIVIPQHFREHLDLKKGEKFMVVEQGGTLMLKRLVPPTKEEFKKLLSETRSHAKKHGLTEKDMHEAIQKARRK
jgi:AbrB family looped-hinge helix DNA binding protein